MKIKHNPAFSKNLKAIIKYIAKDKPMASINFKDNLKNMINNLPNFPEKFRQSEYFDNENIRDMIYKGYTVIYEIDSENNIIEVLDIFNRNKPPQVEK